MMTGTEARALRESTGLDYTEWAKLLGLKVPRSVLNVEYGHPAGTQLEIAWRLLAKQKKRKKPKHTP
jgi:hypothetical protein